MANDDGESSDFQVRTQDDLIKLVGYAEVMKASGVSRSTLERASRGPWDDGEPRLPKPGKIGSRSVWMTSEVNGWLLARARWQSGVVSNLARGSADDLSPDEVEYQVRIYAAEALSSHIGQPVDPNALELRATRALTEGEFTVLEKESHRILADYLSRLTVDQALTVVATLLPQLRPVLMKTASPRSRAALKDATLIDTNFKLVSDFLTLFELQTRLGEQGLRFSGGQTIFDRLAEFGSGRAMVLSAWLFPELQPIYADSVGEMDRPIFSDAETLRLHAMAALNDDKWASFCAEQRAKDQAGRGIEPPSPTVN